MITMIKGDFFKTVKYRIVSFYYTVNINISKGMKPLSSETKLTIWTRGFWMPSVFKQILWVLHNIQFAKSRFSFIPQDRNSSKPNPSCENKILLNIFNVIY